MSKRTSGNTAQNRKGKSMPTAVGSRMGATMEIPLKSLIVPKDWNSRAKLREIDELGSSMAQEGQLTSCLGTRNEDGEIVLLAGFRRVAAAKKLGWDNIRVQIVNVSDPGDPRMVNLIENLQKQGPSSAETAEGLADFAKVEKLDKHGRGVAIAKRLGFAAEGGRFSPSTVNNLLRAFEGLVPAALDAWKKDQISQEAAFTLAARTKEEQELWLPKLKGLGGSTLREAVEVLEDPSTPAADPSSPPGPGKRKPGKGTIKKALAWCHKEGHLDAEATLRWVLGEVKTLKIGDTKFNPRAKPESGDESDGSGTGD